MLYADLHLRRWKCADARARVTSEIPTRGEVAISSFRVAQRSAAEDSGSNRIASSVTERSCLHS